MSKSTSKAVVAAKAAQTKAINGVVKHGSGAAKHGAVLRMASGTGVASMCHEPIGTKEHAGNAAQTARVAGALSGFSKEQNAALAQLARANAKAGGGTLAVDGAFVLHVA